VKLGNGATVEIDGLNERHRVLCEAFSHVGEMKSGQVRKLAQDMLKLIAVERDRGGNWTKVVCVYDQPAANQLSGRSWLAAVARDFGFNIHHVTASESERAKIAAIQHRQRMVNP